VQSAAGIAGYQGWGSGEEGEGGDGGIGYELRVVGFGFGAGWVPELDGAIVCPGSEPPVGEHSQGVHPVGMACQGGFELACGRIPELDGVIFSPRSETLVGQRRQGVERA